MYIYIHFYTYIYTHTTLTPVTLSEKDRHLHKLTWLKFGAFLFVTAAKGEIQNFHCLSLFDCASLRHMLHKTSVYVLHIVFCDISIVNVQFKHQPQGL